MFRWLLLLCLFPAAVAACCPTDKDTLEQEAATYPGVLDLLAGKVERLPPEAHEARLAAAREAMLRSPGVFQPHRDAVEALDQLWRFDEAIELLNALPDERLAASERQQRAMLRARLHLHRWFAAAQPSFSDANAAASALQAAGPQPLLQRIVDWARGYPAAREDELLPDFFGLRLAPNKTALTDNDQLVAAGAKGGAELLFSLIYSHPLWENCDVFYQLGLVFGVEGKQSLALYARLRAMELIDAGKGTRLLVPPGVASIKPLLAPRQMKTGALVEIVTLSEPQQAHIRVDYEARSTWAKACGEARLAHARKRMAEGRNPDTDAAFWAGLQLPEFRPPVPPATADTTAAPPANTPEQNAPAPTAAPTGGGWIVGLAAGGGLGALALLLVARRRRGTAPNQPAKGP